MPTIHLEANVSPSELLDAVEQLGTSELDRFVSQVLALHARRKAPSVPPDETSLLLEINRGLPPELRARLEQLGEKRENEALTADEHDELLRLVTQVEELDVRRIENLSRLAQLRGLSLGALMDRLGISPPGDG